MAAISFCRRSWRPGYMVVPPLSTMLLYRSFLMSTSHFMMEWKVASWTPSCSIPISAGWNKKGYLTADPLLERRKEENGISGPC